MRNASAEGRISTKASRVKTLVESSRSDASRSCSQSSSLPKHPPTSYTSNTPKEEQCLQYISSQLKRNKSDINAHFLYAKNEYNVPKPVISTIRPTLLPYPKLYALPDLLSFVSRYLAYEPLSDPTKPPDILPSPSQVLQSWGVGDSFDLSVVLVSLLLGAGYDACVVVGTAPEWVCKAELGMLEVSADWAGADEESGKTKTDQEEASSDDFAGCMYGWAGPLSSVPAPLVAEGNNERDPLSGKRVHAWVLVKPGQRGEPGDDGAVFADPSIGRIWSAEASTAPFVDEESDPTRMVSHPYISVCSAWNQTNYWSRKQHLEGEDEELDMPLSFDFTNRQVWEPAFPTGDGDDASQLSSDIPSSWVERLEIPRESFELRYLPHGRRVELYHKAKLELFSGSSGAINSSGGQDAMRKLTRYQDVERTEVVEEVECFGDDSRIDYLVERVRRPADMFMKEAYSARHPLSMKKLEQVSGIRRRIEFYSRCRLDGLVSREEIFGENVVEVFDDRPDGLIRRVIQLENVDQEKNQRGDVVLSAADGTNNWVTKTIEKYDLKVQADDSSKPRLVARTFHLDEGKIESQYHVDDGITVSNHTIMHEKEGGHKKDDMAEFESIQETLNAEKMTMASIRALNKEATDLIRMRQKDEVDDCARDSAGPPEIVEEIAPKSTPSPAVKEGKKDGTSGIADFLLPFLLSVQDRHNITKEKAMQVRDACLKTMKDRLLERANIMQLRLNEENDTLSQTQEKYQHGRSKANEEEFKSLCSDLTFRIKILERRLSDHEESALVKYKALEKKLEGDRRLQVLHSEAS